MDNYSYQNILNEFYEKSEGKLLYKTNVLRALKFRNFDQKFIENFYVWMKENLSTTKSNGNIVIDGWKLKKNVKKYEKVKPKVVDEDLQEIKIELKSCKREIDILRNELLSVNMDSVSERAYKSQKLENCKNCDNEGESSCEEGSDESDESEESEEIKGLTLRNIEKLPLRKELLKENNKLNQCYSYVSDKTSVHTYRFGDDTPIKVS